LAETTTSRNGARDDRRYWRDFTDDQKRRVTAAFHDLSIATYAARFDGLQQRANSKSWVRAAPAGNLRVNSQIVPISGERPASTTSCTKRMGNGGSSTYT